MASTGHSDRRAPQGARLDTPVIAAVLEEQFESCPEGILILDHDATILRVNATFLRISGLPGSWIDLPQDQRQAHLFALLEEPLRGIEFTRNAFANTAAAAVEVLQLKDGRWMEVESRPLGEGRRVFYYRDVSARVEAEFALKASEERYRRMFESLHDVYYETDSFGIITAMSPSCLVHTGYTPDELVDTPVVRVWAAPERAGRTAAAPPRGGLGFRFRGPHAA